MMRLCPKDGIKTEEERCPDCGTATLVLAQNPDSKLSEGTEVNGRYRIGRMIGQGGFGAVYKATHLATDQEMAVKVLGISLDSDESDLIQRFFAEAQITAGLKHPNTIRVFDFGQTEGGALYIAMELLSGNDLNDILKERKANGEAMSEMETISVASQTLRSLAEAHMAGLVHRDLKPHNIFLNEVPGDDPVVKVLDFGIAKRLGSNLTGTGQAFGTPNYMSPEQAQNRPIDARSDLYSLGVVMYQCVAMRCPFEGDNPLAVLLSHVTDQPPSLAETAKVPLSAEFIALVERALSKDPFDRFESAIEMRQALRDLSGGPVGRDTISVSSSTAKAVSVRTAAPEGGKGTFGITDHGKQLKLDGAIDAEEATQAYNVSGVNAKVTQTGGLRVDSTEAFAPTAVGAPRGPTGQMPPSAPPGPDNSPVTLDGEGSGFTEAFMGLGDAIVAKAETAKPPVEDPVEVATRSGAGKGVLILIALVLLVGGGTAFYLMSDVTGGPKQADPAAVAGATEHAGGGEVENAAATDEVDAGADEAADAGEKAAASGDQHDAGAETPDAGQAPHAATTVKVLLTTEPPGADVSVMGANIGKTPLELKVVIGRPLTGHLHRSGYHKQDFFVLHTDGPTKKYKLNKKVVKVVAPRPARPKPPAQRPKPVRPKPVKSALEERL